MIYLETLSDVRARVPHMVAAGTPIWLNCTYNLQKDRLYAIKWYLNNQEFYQYLPSNSPPQRIYPTEGIYVDVSKKRANRFSWPIIYFVNRIMLNLIFVEFEVNLSWIQLKSNLPDDANFKFNLFLFNIPSFLGHETGAGWFYVYLLLKSHSLAILS